VNLILLDASDFIDDHRVRLTDRRAKHILEVLGAVPDQLLQVGKVGGELGTGRVLACEPPSLVELEVRLDRPPPERSRVDLLLAVPRPKILRKVLQASASLGIGRLVLLGSYKVDKSYFTSPVLEPEAMLEEFRLGLEQARDTRVPEVTVRRFFKPFVEDELGTLLPGKRLLAHPSATATLDDVLKPSAESSLQRIVLAIGPEGGWTDYETKRLEQSGFANFSAGPRILRVDVAVPYLVGQVERAAGNLSPGPSPSGEG
jgi:RsmE family RNA methyltransferase